MVNDVIQINVLKTVEDTLNDFFNESPYSTNVYGNFQSHASFILDDDTLDFSFAISAQYMKAQQFVINQEFDITNDGVKTLITQADLNGEDTINSTSFVNSISQDAGFLNTQVKVKKIHFDLSNYAVINPHLLFTYGFRVKLSSYELSNNIVSIQPWLDSYIGDSTSQNLEKLEDNFGEFLTTKSEMTANLDTGFMVFGKNLHLGMNFIDIYPWKISFPSLSNNCNTENECAFISSNYADKTFGYEEQLKVRPEIGYLSDSQKLYFFLQGDLKSWTDYDLLESKIIKATLGVNSYPKNSSREGFRLPHPKVKLTYLYNSIRKSNFIQITLSAWQLYLSFAGSGDLLDYIKKYNLQENSSEQSDDKKYNLMFTIGFSNAL